jgi:hypothetical protein
MISSPSLSSALIIIGLFELHLNAASASDLHFLSSLDWPLIPYPKVDRTDTQMNANQVSIRSATRLIALWDVQSFGVHFSNSVANAGTVLVERRSLIYVDSNVQKGSLNCFK